ncbi:amidohydrolase family protein [Georgenia halophila]|uniref:Amidohydrolase family protein n=1 Tax=Georgenia halophila TaxID=620889 RepID=A0ABP8LLA9_9MICO
MTVIDIHTHMVNEEWLDMLLKHSDGKYAVGDVPGGHKAVYKGGTAFMTLTDGMFDYEGRIRAMDAAGVDVSVISLTCPNVFWGGSAVSLRAAQIVNDDMAAAQRRYPDRVRFFASVPWQYPEEAVGELDRACRQGAVGVMVLANIDGASLTDPRFAEVWNEIDRRELPVLVHPASPPGLEEMDLDRFHLVWSIGFTFDTTLALSRMIMDGFFDRYPNLKIIGGHAGGYLPFVVTRLDKGFQSFESCREKIARPPSSYLSQIYVDSIVYDARTLHATLDIMGADNVLYGTDFPHKNGKMEEIIELVDALPQHQSAKIFGANADRIFDLS